MYSYTWPCVFWHLVKRDLSSATVQLVIYIFLSKIPIWLIIAFRDDIFEKTVPIWLHYTVLSIYIVNVLWWLLENDLIGSRYIFLTYSLSLYFDSLLYDLMYVILLLNHRRLRPLVYFTLYQGRDNQGIIKEYIFKHEKDFVMWPSYNSSTPPVHVCNGLIHLPLCLWSLMSSL